MKRLITALLCILCCLLVQGQVRNKQYEAYIKKYRDIAVEEMRKYHIPASITLAQGLLESGAGQSTLARKSNNHFGIAVVDILCQLYLVSFLVQNLHIQT